MTFEPSLILPLIAIGLATGIIGGMIGIGGSIVIIPSLAILFHDREWASQHLLQAAAMVVNVAVAIPAAIRHRARGAVRGDLFRFMLPAAIVFIIVGVFTSNLLSGEALRKVFALFLVYVVIDEFWKLLRRSPDYDPALARITRPRGTIVGGTMGFTAGLLGIGGGGIAVPLARVVCRLPVREAIGTASAVMCLTAVFGATTKLATLEQHHARWQDALMLALMLAPSAVVGGYLGADLTHRMPVRAVRIVFAITLLVGAGRMGGLY